VSRVLRPPRHIKGNFGDESITGNQLHLHWYWQHKTNRRKYNKNTTIHKLALSTEWSKKRFPDFNFAI